MLNEILYDMVHNSICGSIALVTSILLVTFCVIFIVLCFIHGNLCYTHNLSSLKKILVKNGKIRSIYIFTFWFMTTIILFSMIIFIFCDWRVDKHKRIYLDSPLAEPKDSDILFEKDTDAIDAEWMQVEYMQKLHLPENEIVSDITLEKIEARMEQFDAIYQTGNKASGNDRKYSPEKNKELENIRNVVSSMSAKNQDDYKREFEYWCELYKYYEYPSDIYQCSRAARDVLEVAHGTLDDQELLKFASESIYYSENFLGYANRNVSSKNHPIIKEVDDIAFNNGKVYYQLYLEAKKRQQLGKYDKEFLLSAYACMKQAEEEMAEDNVNYALVTYYIGNICELMAMEMPTDNEYYKKIVAESMNYYTKALECVEKIDNYYNEEINMRQNISDGLKTVGAL